MFSSSIFGYIFCSNKFLRNEVFWFLVFSLFHSHNASYIIILLNLIFTQFIVKFSLRCFICVRIVNSSFVRSWVINIYYAFINFNLHLLGRMQPFSCLFPSFIKYVLSSSLITSSSYTLIPNSFFIKFLLWFLYHLVFFP